MKIMKKGRTDKEERTIIKRNKCNCVGKTKVHCDITMNCIENCYVDYIIFKYI